MNNKNKDSNIYDINLKNNIYKKIDNYYSQININTNNRITKNKEKENIILLNKQKIISANTNSLNSHVSRLLNLKKLKSKNNFNSKLLKNFKSNNNEKKDFNSTEKQMMYKRKYHYNKNENDNTPSISTLAYTKKYISNSINAQNIKEDKLNKFRVGLLSACNSNKNILIPLITLQRPLSNFNIGVQFNKGKEKEKENKDIKQIKLNLMKRMIKNENIRQKISTAPTRKRENYLSNEDKKKMMDKKYNNLFGYEPKFHHIKIDRSLLSNKMKESFSKSKILSYINLRENKFPKIRKKYKYNDIKKMIQMNNNNKSQK
jgi:hypothetical protein